METSENLFLKRDSSWYVTTLLRNTDLLPNWDCLDIGIYTIFDNRCIRLTVRHLFGIPIPVDNNYRVNYWLPVDYQSGLPIS